MQAGASEQGQTIAAAHADVVYSAHQDLAAVKAYYADVKGRLTAHARAPDELLIMPGVTPFVGRTRQEAREKFEMLNELVNPELRRRGMFRKEYVAATLRGNSGLKAPRNRHEGA